LEGRRGLARFVDVPWHIYDPVEHPQWVPPLRAQVTGLLDPRRSPFLDELKRRGTAYGAVGADASWVLEYNMLIRRPIEAVGGKVTRMWRIYERPVPSPMATHGP
jgi:hypothetical protein